MRLALLLLLAGCGVTAGRECETAHVVYYGMVAGGAPKGALDNAEEDVAEICQVQRENVRAPGPS